VTALSIVGLIGIAAFTIDLGRVYMAKNELQNAADSAALAGARALGELYKTMSVSSQLSLTLTTTQVQNIQTMAANAAFANLADNKSLQLAGADLQVGKWTNKTHIFTPTTAVPNAVRVTTRLDNTVNGAMNAIFAGVIGVERMGVSAQATAALTGLASTADGVLNAPFALSERWFSNHQCSDPVSFSPTDSCASWQAFRMTGTSAGDLTNVITILDSGACPKKNGKPVAGCAESSVVLGTIAGSTQFNFNGGAVQSVMPDLELLYNHKKDATGTWNVFIPVYLEPAASGCGNPNGFLTILGYTEVAVKSVVAATKTISGIVQCDTKQIGRGGGNDFGLLATIPNLVE
jgi:Flp pilus assembly protein TadG